MKRSDVLALLAGTVITGIGWYLGGIKWGLPLAIVAVVAFVLIHIFVKDRPAAINPNISQSANDSLKQSLENVGNPTQTQNASPIAYGKYEEHHHHYPAPSSPVALPIKSAPVQQEQPKHNLVFLGAAIVKIAYSGPGFSGSTDGMQSFSEVAGLSKGDMIGLVARFRNEAIYGEDIKPIRGARAHLKLFDKNSREIGTGFSAALWLGHRDDTFDLIPNGPGGSVLVCWGSKTKAHVSWKTRTGVRLHDNEIELHDGYPSKADVTILDSQDRPLLPPITLEITTENGEITVTPSLSLIPYVPTKERLGRALSIEWHPDEDEYVHKYPPGTTDNIHYRLKVVNVSDRYVTDINVKLERLVPRALDCVPCDLHLMNDNADKPEDNLRTFSLAPNGGYRFIDLLLQWPNGNEFWILHTVPKQPRVVTAQGYTMTVVASAANCGDERKSFRLIKVGPIWNMIEI